MVAGPKRRRYTGEYKLRIVRAAHACRGQGEIGGLLRREGLYSSHLRKWRRQAAAGSLALSRRQAAGPARLTRRTRRSAMRPASSLRSTGDPGDAFRGGPDGEPAAGGIPTEESLVLTRSACTLLRTASWWRAASPA
ncbi:MAG: transposase [Planctomycetes bacterium]|nr:transposase [Planctomycetota bacterium]